MTHLGRTVRIGVVALISPRGPWTKWSPKLPGGGSNSWALNSYYARYFIFIFAFNPYQNGLLVNDSVPISEMRLQEVKWLDQDHSQASNGGLLNLAVIYCISSGQTWRTQSCFLLLYRLGSRSTFWRLGCEWEM